MNAAPRGSDTVFAQAIEIVSAEERALFLESACAHDPELKREVEKLVRDHFRAGAFLERPPVQLAATLDAPPAETPGTVIGPYKLLEQIGEGGMGLVFMAEQTRPVRRRVALKVLKPGMDTRQVAARFEAERQALALMDHPNIAKIHDAGATASGRPYFVMELVRGVPVTDFCDQRRLTTRQRLELFVLVCHAVQHAHQRGIIHRDLKPSNVLVTLHDTVAVPKVIDFGIAKATSQPLTERTLFTHFAQMVGTPLYMSPEQAEMNGLDVDTRSDVYALGVLLYELLTGTTSFEGATLSKMGWDEMRRIIREEEPPRPSHRVNTLGVEACSTVSERRGVDGRRLGQVLRGELDWIVMKALEKDRNRRYESASALAADVQRYLSDELVQACPPSAAYRMRTFARRHRRSLLTAGLFAALLIAATAVSTWQAVVARDAQHHAETAEGRAATEAAIARAVNDFLQHDLLRYVDPEVQRGEGFPEEPNLTLKEALHRAAARIGDRFQNQPLVEAAIRRTIADGYRSLGDDRRAVPHLERAVELHKAYLGPDHPETLASTYNLTQAYRWGGRRSDAIALFEQLLEHRKATLGPNHVETLSCIDDLAEVCENAGQCLRAKLLYQQVLEKRQAILGPAHPDTLHSMQSLAWTNAMLGHLQAALDAYEKVLKLYEATLGPEHEDTRACVKDYGIVCQRAGKLDEAERLLRLALERTRKQEASAGRRGTNVILDQLGHNLLLQKKYAMAEPLLREAVAIKEIYRHDDWRRFGLESLLGAALMGQQQYAAAEPLLLRGCEGLLEREALIQAAWKYRVAEAVGFLVRFYEETNQPEKALLWREKAKPTRSDAAATGMK